MKLIYIQKAEAKKSKGDSWCSPMISPKSGKQVSGAAAREMRIALSGKDLDEIIFDAATEAVRNAFAKVNEKAAGQNRTRLRSVG